MKGSSHSSDDHHSRPRTFSETLMEENMDYAQDVILKWDVYAHKHHNFSSIFAHDRKEAKTFIQAVTALQTAMHYYVRLSSNSDKIIRAQKLMQTAMKRLEKEFYVTLSANRKNLDSESVSSRSSKASTRSSISDFYEDEASEEEDKKTTPSRGENTISESESASDIAMADLKSIADCMIASGYGKECVKIYKIIRKSIIDETLYYLGAENLSTSQIQKMEWNVLEQKIKTWLHAVKIGVKTLFSGERTLCDVVFESSEQIAQSCFTEISTDAAVKLFSFPENFARSKKILSPEKMFRALDLYEAISDLWPEIESIFSHESLSAVRSAAVAALLKLGDAVRVMLSQFEAAIQKDSSKSPSGGGVHPLTRYVMNFLVFLGDYNGAVADIVADWPSNARTPLPESYFSSPTSDGGADPSSAEITARLAWLILVLLCKLDGKAVLYGDVSLSYLFLANNLNYVVSKVRNSNLGLLMGPDWIWKHRSKVKQYLANYERMGWTKVISSLPENPTAEISPQEVRECFRGFNSSFEETYKKQSTWIIPDPKTRDEVKISLAKKILPGYRIFYQKYRWQYNREMGVESIVRYAPEDLSNYLSDLFFAVSGTSCKSSSYETSLDSSMTSRGR
ncbi:hypothetical protein BUALT_Bualt13G0084600 [Buddleja alternifolia]|uniref:Exocyst subunit Exo70 family protein n=1 Tax=Buddleja alternifolia TaxID=168488 RepID=A0AAV6WWS1_9LAMI|nr:hypothetical protein BUALT_Bualt13G0084600 [Buddleja alternifolia]